MKNILKQVLAWAIFALFALPFNISATEVNNKQLIGLLFSYGIISPEKVGMAEDVASRLDEPRKMANVSVSGEVDGGIIKFVTEFSVGKGNTGGKFLIRGIGRTLASRGSSMIFDPVLYVYKDGKLLVIIDDWTQFLSEKEKAYYETLAGAIPLLSNFEAAAVLTLDEGLYSIIAFDYRGSKGDVQIEVLNVDVLNQAPGKITVTAPEKGMAGAIQRVTASAVDPEDDIIVLAFDWDADGKVDEYSKTWTRRDPVFVVHAWDTVGTHKFVVTARDLYGNISAPHEQIITITR